MHPPLLHGLLLFAHGARDPRWAQPFDDMARRIRTAHPGTPVETAYLDFIQPPVEEAGRRLAELGCTQVTLQPMFLGAGGHVRQDVPVMMDRLRAAHPGIEWHLRPAIGEVDSVVQAMADAAVAGLGSMK